MRVAVKGRREPMTGMHLMDANCRELFRVNSRLSCRIRRQRVQIGLHKRDAVFLG